MNETQLLQAYASHRDAEAFAEIVRRYQRLIFATCRRTLHHADDTDDAVQETFLRLAEKSGELRTNLGAWLHTCAIHVSIDTNRRRSTRSRHESAAQTGEIVNDPKHELRELREHLDKALEKIEADQRELIIQRFFVGRSQIDLAAEAGVSPSAITHRMNGAIDALRQYLRSAGCITIAGSGAGALVHALEAEQASAVVPAALTQNLLKIGLSGAPPVAVAAGAGSIPLVLQALAAIILVIAISVGIWFGIAGMSPSPNQASTGSAMQPSSAPVMTVTGEGQAEVAPAPRWQKSAPVPRPRAQETPASTPIPGSASAQARP